MKKTRYLIAGCGPAGVRCAEEIRRRDVSGSITVLSPEDTRPYSRITAPEYMTGEIEQENIYFKPETFYEEHNITCLGSRLCVLRPEEHVAVLENGEEILYGKLLLATGSSAAMPPWAEPSLPGMHSLWGKADAERLAGEIIPGEPAVVIGGGLVGMQAARALNGLGIPVTVLEAAERLMPQQLDAAAAGMLEQAARRAGVEVRTGVFVESITRKNGRVSGVLFKTGERLNAAHVLVCVGAIPNLDMLAKILPDWRRGVEVDEFMRTKLPDVYAAGDVARAAVFEGGGKEVRAIWHNAVRQGAIAGMNMTGAAEEYEGARAQNSIQLFGLAVASAGIVLARQGMREQVISPASTGTYLKIIVDGENLSGALIAGDIRGAGPLFAKLGGPLTGFLGSVGTAILNS